MSYRPTETELEALVRLVHNPEWAVVQAMLVREHSAQVRIHGTVSDTHTLFRAQGAATALNDLLELAGKASQVLRDKRDRHTNPGLGTPVNTGAWG